MREIVLDIETTGLEYNLGHKIIEIACLELLNFIPTGETYQTFVTVSYTHLTLPTKA